MKTREKKECFQEARKLGNRWQKLKKRQCAKSSILESTMRIKACALFRKENSTVRKKETDTYFELGIFWAQLIYFVIKHPNFLQGSQRWNRTGGEEQKREGGGRRDQSREGRNEIEKQKSFIHDKTPRTILVCTYIHTVCMPSTHVWYTDSAVL